MCFPIDFPVVYFSIGGKVKLRPDHLYLRLRGFQIDDLFREPCLSFTSLHTLIFGSLYQQIRILLKENDNCYPSLLLIHILRASALDAQLVENNVVDLVYIFAILKLVKQLLISVLLPLLENAFLTICGIRCTVSVIWL